MERDVKEKEKVEIEKVSCSENEDVMIDGRLMKNKRKREEEGKEDGLKLVKCVRMEECCKEEEMNGKDPLEFFGRDILLKILSNLDARSVAPTLLVSRAWHSVASSDALWSPKCEELWHDKAHIPRVAYVRRLSKFAIYSHAVMDGKRTRIMKDDLFDHSWDFHFNKGVPDYWKDRDPYWRGTGPPMRRYFHPDGSHTADPGDKVWGGHECCFSIVTSIIADETIRSHYVRINRWPQMSVSRNKDWSWEMRNELWCYSSIPDADKEGGTGPPFLAV